MHPYSKKYIEILEKNSIEYDMIYWNRSGISESDKHMIPFDYPLNTYSSRISKIKGYIKYRQFVLKYLNSEEYDKVVFLTTQAMVFFFPVALTKYCHKYIFDYRDETYESNKFYKFIVQMCIRNSYKVTISSPGFIKIFDTSYSDKFVLCHNKKDNTDSIIVKKVPSDKIRITYWGQIRLPEYFIKIIDVFKNDSRFELSFHGEGSAESMIKYVDENKVTNVSFTGRFNQADIYKFASETDVLMNCYPNNSYQRQALTVKMYEGISFGIPMLLQKDSFMSKYLKENDYPFIEADFDNLESSELIKHKTLNFSEAGLHGHKIEDVIRNDLNKFSHMVENFLQEEYE